MPEPLRRRVRARLLQGISSAVGSGPEPLVRRALHGAAALARFSRFEALALENLERALGAETTARQRASIARGVRRHSARLLLEWARLARGGRSERERERMLAWLESTVELDPSIAIVDEVAARGRGCIVVTAHIGNWELAAATLRRRGLDGAVIGLRKRNDPSAEWLVAMRRAYGVETLPQDAPPRRLLEVLRSGGTLGILADLEARRIDGEVVPFFGLPARTMTAPAALARAARLPLVAVRCVATGARYRLSAEAPLELEPSLPRREATRDLCARLNAVIERWIRETPEQWAWHQRRWSK